MATGRLSWKRSAIVQQGEVRRSSAQYLDRAWSPDVRKTRQKTWHRHRPRTSGAARRSITALLVGGWLTLTSAGAQTAPGRPQPASAPVPDAADTRALLDRYCVVCHNARLLTGGLALDTLDADAPAAHADVWEQVIQKLRTGTMPPAGRDPARRCPTR